MRQQGKRFLSLILCLTLVLGILPAPTAVAGSMTGGWYDPITDKDLYKAETTNKDDTNQSIVLYPGEDRVTSYSVDEDGYTRYVSSNPNKDIADVYAGTSKFEVAAYKEGYKTAIIQKKSDTMYYVVRVLDPRLDLDTKTVSAVLGKTKDVTVTATPVTKTGKETVSWTTSDPDVATVSNGVIHFTGVGTATVTASIDVEYSNAARGKWTETKKNTVSVTVRDTLDSITLDKTQLDLFTGDSETVTITGWSPSPFAKPNGETLTAADFTWRSTDPDKVSVTEVSGTNGASYTVKGLKAGSAIVYVTHEDVTQPVIVYVSDREFQITPSVVDLLEGQNLALNVRLVPTSAGEDVTIKSNTNPDVARVQWLDGKECVVTALSEGTTVITLTMPYEIAGTPYTIDQSVTVNVAPQADPDAKRYNVTFVDIDGTVIGLKAGEEGDTVEVPAPVSTHEGFNFIGYEDDITGAFYHTGDNYTVTGNAVLTAQYDVKKLTVTFQDSDFTSTNHPETLPAPITVDYGKAAFQPDYGVNEYRTAISADEYRYYELIGWKNVDTDEMYDFSQKVTENLTLKPEWEIVTCEIMRRTYRGIYGDNIVVPKGTLSVNVKGLKQFQSSDGELYRTTFTNDNGVGKDVYFQFWQYRDDQITTDTYTLQGPVLMDLTITAVYEPGFQAVFGGNNSTSSYYHSTDVYVPVNYINQTTGRQVKFETILTDVYPLYGVTESPVYHLKYDYGYHVDPDAAFVRDQDRWSQLEEGVENNKFTCYNVEYSHTAKYGRVNLDDYVGTEFVGTDGKTYVIDSVDYSTVETVWLCTMLGHTFNGYCCGGTWNALGQATFYTREKSAEKATLKVNYYVLPNDWEEGDSTDGSTLKSTDMEILPMGSVLNSKAYYNKLGGYYTYRTHEWVTGSDGLAVTAGGDYELNVYYSNTKYTLTIHYLYRDDSTQVFDDYVQTGMLNQQDYNRASPVKDGYAMDKDLIAGVIHNADAEFTVWYERAVTLYYKALAGGGVTSASEKVAVKNGIPKGSVAVPDPYYTVVGWYAEEECTNELADTAAFKPTKDDNEEWIDGTTYWAKFECACPITVTSLSGTWVYDGKDHTEGYQVTFDGKAVTADSGSNGLQYTLPTGDKLTITPASTATVKNATSGPVKNDYTYTIENGETYANVTATYGALRVDPRSVEVVVSSGTITYDGENHTVSDASGVTEDYTYNKVKATDDGTGVLAADEDTLKSLIAVVYDSKGVKSASQKDVGSYPASVLNASDNMMGDNYVLSFVNGRMDIITDPTPITVKSPSASKTYDGTALKDEDYTVTYGGTTLTDPEKQTDGSYVFTIPGKKSSTITVIPKTDGVTHVDPNGQPTVNDFEVVVSSGYATPTLTKGTLEVLPRTVEVVVAQGTVTYDGKDHTVTDDPGVSEDYTYNKVKPTDDGTGVLPADENNLKSLIAVEYDKGGVKTPTEKEIGSYPASVKDAAPDMMGPDYVLSFVNGQLDILPDETPITVTSPSATKVYDGTPLTDEHYTVTYGGITLTDPEKQPDGSYVYTIPGKDSATITVIPKTDGVTDVDPNGNPTVNDFEVVVSSGYATPTLTKGTLEVIPRTVEVVVSKGTVTYDGKDHTVTDDPGVSTDYTYNKVKPTDDGTGILPADESKLQEKVAVEYDKAGVKAASEKEIGSYPASVKDASADLLGPNYVLTFIDGQLDILPDETPITVTSPSATKVYDGTPLTDEHYTVTYGGITLTDPEKQPDGSYVYTIPGKNSATITVIPKTDGVTDVDPNGNPTVNDFEVIVSDGYATPTLTKGTLEVTPRPVEVTVSRGTVVYDGRTHIVSDDPGVDVDYTYNKVKPTDDGTGILPADESKLKDKVTVEYDKDGVKEPREKDVGTYPASVKDATPDLLGPNYVVTFVDGQLDIVPDETPISVTSPSDSKVYDGTPLTNEDYIVKYGDTVLTDPARDAEGNYVYPIPGKNGATIVVTPKTDGVTHVDPNGNPTVNDFEVIVSDGYATPTLTKGTLEVQPRAVEVVVAQGTVIYDGKEHTVIDDPGVSEDYTYNKVKPTDDGTGVLPADEDSLKSLIAVEYDKGGVKTPTEKDIGSYPASVKDAAPDMMGPDYVVSFVKGQLDILPDETPITVTSPSATKVYDGTPLTDEHYTVTYGGTVLTDPEKQPDGSYVYTIPGKKSATVTVIPKTDGVTDVDPNGNPTVNDFEVIVSDGYATPTLTKGTLEVTPRPVEVTVSRGTVVYDGRTHIVSDDPGVDTDYTYNKVKPTDDGTGILPADENKLKDKVTVEYDKDGVKEPREKDVGTYPASVKDATPDLLGPNYVLTFVDGQLDILPDETPITVTSPSATKVYDGTPLKNEEYIVKYGDTILTDPEKKPDGSYAYPIPGTDGQTIIVTPKTDGVTNVDPNGKPTPNDFEVTVPNGFTTPEVNKGSLEVVPREVVITVKSASLPYDGENHTVLDNKDNQGQAYTYPTQGSGEPGKGVLPKDKDRFDDLTVVYGNGEDPSEKDPGQYKAQIDPDDLKELQEQLGDNYRITVIDGSLTISPKEPDPNKDPDPNKNPDPGKDPDPSKNPDPNKDPDPNEGPTTDITVHYWFEEVGEDPAAPTVERTYHPGEEYNIISPRIPGYEVDIKKVTGTVKDEDEVYDVIYTPIDYHLTIRYVDLNGNPVADPYQDVLNAQDLYSVPVPTVDGMIPSRNRVSGEMPPHDVVITVIYVSPQDGYILIPDYEPAMCAGEINLNICECYE